MKRKWWIAGVAGAAVVTLIGAGVVMAQTPTPVASGSSPSFLDRVAQKLGIETPKLQDAIKSASSDQIDAEVAAGKITQAQADKLKQAIANGKLPGFEGPLGEHGPGKGGFGLGRGLGAGVDMNKLATFLGISQAQLKTELEAPNATLATVAQAHGKSSDQLKSFITSTAKTQLDQAVTSKKLTQQQADNALSMLTNNLDNVINGKAFGPHMHGRMKPDGPDTPNSSATPGAGTRFRGPAAPSAPITIEPPVAAPVPAPAFSPMPAVPPAPGASTLPEPTAPFSSAAPASLGDRIINPITPIDQEPINNIADQMNQELNTPPAAPASTGAPTSPPPAPVIPPAPGASL